MPAKVIAENINVMSKSLGPAMRNRDAGPIIEMAKKLEAAGADYLDVNIGPAKKDGTELLPWLVRELQCVIGREAREQILRDRGRLPDVAVACVGGGSNAIGLFHPLLGDETIELLGIEAGGTGCALGEHAATLRHGSPGVLHGSHSMLLQDPGGQVQETHSVSAGLDYPGVGPEHAFLQAVGRVVHECTRDHVDLGFRYGGDEFTVILPEADEAQAHNIAERIRRGFEALAYDDLTLSIGLMSYDEDVTLRKFVQFADAMMYDAKRSGGNQVFAYQRDRVVNAAPK